MIPNVFFTTRNDGDTRRKKFNDTIFAQQIHGNNVAVVTIADVNRIIPGTDGLIYRYRGGPRVRLAVRVADCVPILAWNTDPVVIGAAHAGWRGTLGNITGNLIAAMKREGAQVKNIHISIGPHIGMCCYNVPADRAKRFLQAFSGDGKAASLFKDAWHVDIGWANYRQSIQAGILPEHIRAPIVCTSCQVDRYFSYRKDTKESFGEQIGAIWIEN